ncbi:MAG: A/G-specific adenine glycosylase [Candidatus Pacebacteria bacterium]|nr:A/G-specific adenine glycosylase [Candidatus Paceibacterota bacterium]
MKQYSINLLAWYDDHRREFEWRDRGMTPYQIWLSEVMLQQTGTKTVTPYYLRFIARFPTVAALAEAEPGEVLKLWAGLGYYARGRNLHRAAEMVMAEFGGEFPDQESLLLRLPGVGTYTAAAIAAIAFDRRAVVVDGNVERILSRYFAVEEFLPQAKPRLRELAEQVTPQLRNGDFAQASFDLGATICRPRNPDCGHCPLRRDCRALAMDAVESFPKKGPKPQRPQRFGTVFWLEDETGNLLLRHRPPQGLLGGMVEIPSSEWQAVRPNGQVVTDEFFYKQLEWQETGITVSHVFTHFALELQVIRAFTAQALVVEPPWFWARREELPHLALPSLFRKVIKQMERF